MKEMEWGYSCTYS